MIHRNSRDAFTAKEWLAADGDARLPNDKSLGEGFRCDALDCLAALPDGKLVSQVILPDAFNEDCARGAVVVTSRDTPGDCQALAINRKLWRASGAIASRRNDEGFAIERARPAGEERPWARGAVVEEPAVPAKRPQPRDATPKAEDMEVGD
jgi:competence protein ComEC